MPVPDELKNPWPAEWEKEFQARGERVLNGMCAKGKAAGLGNRTYFESEKRAYGFLMAHMLAGDKDVATTELQKEDVQAKQWHAHTAGIDYLCLLHPETPDSQILPVRRPVRPGVQEADVRRGEGVDGEGFAIA